MLCKKNNLPAVVGIVNDRAVDRLHDRVGLSPDGNGTREIRFGETLKSGQQAVPTLLPARHQLCARRRNIFEFAIAVAIRLLAVGGQKVGPSRPKITGNMLNDHRKGVRLVVESDEDLVVGYL